MSIANAGTFLVLNVDQLNLQIRWRIYRGAKRCCATVFIRNRHRVRPGGQISYRLGELGVAPLKLVRKHAALNRHRGRAGRPAKAERVRYRNTVDKQFFGFEYLNERYRFAPFRICNRHRVKTGFQTVGSSHCIAVCPLIRIGWGGAHYLNGSHAVHTSETTDRILAGIKIESRRLLDTVLCHGGTPVRIGGCDSVTSGKQSSNNRIGRCDSALATLPDIAIRGRASTGNGIQRAAVGAMAFDIRYRVCDNQGQGLVDGK